MDRASLNDHPELLLDQTSWVRGLARSLAIDAAGAEDVAQETMLAALQSEEHSEGDVPRLRAWLAGVVTNLTNLRVRRDSRRRVREEWVAKPEPTPSVAETVSRAAQLRLVVDEVMDLGEPYRSTILLRYFDGLSTRQIAEALDCSPEAVRKRLSRALRRLREGLDRKHGGDGSAWLTALAPFIGDLRAAPTGVQVGVSTSTSAATVLGSLAAGALLLVGGGTLGRALLSAPEAVAAALPVPGALLVALDEARPDQDPAPRRESLAQRSAALPAASADAEAPGARHVEQIVVVDEGEPPPPARPYPALSGRVLDLAGRPVAGLTISTLERPAQALARSGGDGGFDLHFTEGEGRLVATGDGYATLRAARVDDLALVAQPVIVVGPAVDLAGRVVDAAGEALPGARIALAESDAALHGFPERLQRTVALERLTRSQSDGGFRVAGWVSGPGLAVVVDLEGYQSLSFPVPAGSETDLAITMVRDPMRVLHGIALHRDGQPAGGARIELGPYSTLASAQGLFRLEHRPVAPETALSATRAGFVSGCLPSFGAFLNERGVARPVRIVLGGPARSIAGNIRDHQGRPVAGWETFAVAVADPGSAEDPAGPVPQSALSAKDGGFLLTGLAEGSYVVHAVDTASLVVLRSEVVRAGGAVVQFQVPERPFRSVEGRVVARDGMPLADARVSVVLEYASLGRDEPMRPMRVGESVRTDGRGWFALPNVPHGFVDLCVEHAEVAAVVHDLDAAPDPSALRIEVARDRFLQVFDRAFRGRFVEVRGVDGRPRSILGPDGRWRHRARVDAGRSSVLQVTEDADQLIAYEDDVEVERVPIDAGALGVSRVDLGHTSP